MNRVRRCIGVVAMFAFAHAFGQTEYDELDSDQDFDLPGAEMAELVGDGGVDLEDADFVGNPLKRFVNN